ncbi:uncharacterized protein LOC143230927 [Tachypleus tridentatus]|uniref:uncharacterized protein LOC143230927 n=1 Tax=Tachypleus tridentatus TaxID=6853 RepID=UPI003FD0FF03
MEPVQCDDGLRSELDDVSFDLPYSKSICPLELTQDHVPELAELSTPELSFNLQELINVNNSQVDELSDSVSLLSYIPKGAKPAEFQDSSSCQVDLSELLSADQLTSESQLSSNNLSSLLGMPQQNDLYRVEASLVNSTEDQFFSQQPLNVESNILSNSKHLSIKEQELKTTIPTVVKLKEERVDNTTNCYRNGTFSEKQQLDQDGDTNSSFGLSTEFSTLAEDVEIRRQKSCGISIKSTFKNKGKKNIDKSSEEYRKRRERNNIAVRKSREKAKRRANLTNQRVNELLRENEALWSRIDLLSKELSVLKTLLKNVGLSVDNLDPELRRKLEVDKYL